MNLFSSFISVNNNNNAHIVPLRSCFILSIEVSVKSKDFTLIDKNVNSVAVLNYRVIDFIIILNEGSTFQALIPQMLLVNEPYVAKENKQGGVAIFRVIVSSAVDDVRFLDVISVSSCVIIAI